MTTDTSTTCSFNFSKRRQSSLLKLPAIANSGSHVESAAQYKEEKRQMFMVNLDLKRKQEEITKLDEMARDREEALRLSECVL